MAILNLVFLFFLSSGKNDVVGENFCQNDTVGRSKGTVRALTYCDLLTLSRNDLNEVCELYPEFRKHFAEKVEVTIDMRDVSNFNEQEIISHPHQGFQRTINSKPSWT